MCSHDVRMIISAHLFQGHANTLIDRRKSCLFRRKVELDFVTEGSCTIYEVLVLRLLLVNPKLLHDLHPLFCSRVERLLR
jgi:hypothetical protein